MFTRIFGIKKYLVCLTCLKIFVNCEQMLPFVINLNYYFYFYLTMKPKKNCLNTVYLTITIEMYQRILFKYFNPAPELWLCVELYVSAI